MKISYDYEIFIAEINNAIDSGALDPDGHIQVLRAQNKIIKDYRPIIDWYFDKEKMRQLLEDDVTDTKEDKQQQNDIKEDYERDAPNLETMSTKSVLEEITFWNKITSN